MIFEKVPVPSSCFREIDFIPKYPDKTYLSQTGLWYFPIDELANVYSLPELKTQLQVWSIDDIKMGWLYYYFYYDLTFKKKLIDRICATYNIILPSLPNKLAETLFKKEVLQFASSIDYWNDEIEEFPVNLKFDQFNNVPCQICKDEMMFIKPEFKIALFKHYCTNWVYNGHKSSKKIMVFDKKAVFLNDYVWQVVIRSSKAFVNTFEVMLAKKIDRKLTPKNVIFQLLFPNVVFPDLSAGQLLNSWKAEAAFRYKYVERYINYIEPLIAERMQGVE